MHTFSNEGCKIIYNSDLSGTVIIINDKDEEMEIPSSLLKEFFADFIRQQKISALENMSTAEILKNI